MALSTLTSTEQNVLPLRLIHHSHFQIGEQLGMDEKTSRNHMTNVRGRFDIIYELLCEPVSGGFRISGRCRLVPLKEADDPQLKLQFDWK